jgi:hypothetical protein
MIWVRWRISTSRRAMLHQLTLLFGRFDPHEAPNKNDATDAEAICEAVRRPSMRA